jgi:hypothetical protein
MGLDWTIQFKTEAGEYVSADEWGGGMSSRYYGPYPDPDEGWYEKGDWPRIQQMLVDLMSKHKSPIYYGSDHHDVPVLVTPDLLKEITEHYIKNRE